MNEIKEKVIIFCVENDICTKCFSYSAKDNNLWCESCRKKNLIHVKEKKKKEGNCPRCGLKKEADGKRLCPKCREYQKNYYLRNKNICEK